MGRMDKLFRQEDKEVQELLWRILGSIKDTWCHQGRAEKEGGSWEML